MPLPKVNINIKDGALGRTLATADGIAGMVITGIAGAGIPLNTPKRLFALADAITLGITLATHPHAYGEISDFYDEAKNGAELWINLVSEVTTAASVFVQTTGPMDKLLKAAKGTITIAATSMGRAGGYTAVPTGLLDYDLGAVATSAQSLADAWRLRFSPVRIILDGTYLINPLTGITSVKGAGDRVGVFIGSNKIGKRSASIGKFLGRLAAIPVHQSIARVKTGPFSDAGFLTSGLSIDDYTEGNAGALHDAGYMTLVGFNGVFGAYVSDDLTLAEATSDFARLANGRVIDKAIRLVYQTYVLELNETVEITAEGKLQPTRVSYIEDIVLRQLTTQMLGNGNCSFVDVYVDPAQNVLSTSELNISVDIIPLGYLKTITVNLGFSNPALA